MRKTLVGEFTAHTAPAYFPRRAIRDARYKLIHNLLAGERRNPIGAIDKCSAFAVGMEGEGVDPVVRKAYQTYDNPPEWELYDLEKDPVEFHNLADSPAHASIRERLTRELADWQKATDDPVRTTEGLRELTRDFEQRAKARRNNRQP